MRNDNFVRLPDWLLAEPEHLTVPEFMVYIVLLRYRNHYTGQCFPGFGTISRESRLSRSTVMRTIKALENAGVIHVDRQRNKANTYTVKLPHEAFPPSATGTPPSTTHAAPTAPSLEFLGGVTETPPSAMVTPPSATETPRLVSQGHPNQKEITRKRNQTDEPAATVDESTAPAGFTEIHPPPSITDAQLDYLKDLYLHITGEPAPGPQLDSWTKLTVAEADDVIASWKKSFEHATDYSGPEPGTDAYDALTATGQAWADAQMVKEDFIAPDSHIVEDKILKHLQRHGARTNRQLRDALTTEQRRSLKPILNRLIDDGTITTAEHYSSPAATRPGLVYSLTDPDERTA